MRRQALYMVGMDTEKPSVYVVAAIDYDARWTIAVYTTLAAAEQHQAEAERLVSELAELRGRGIDTVESLELLPRVKSVLNRPWDPGTPSIEIDEMELRDAVPWSEQPAGE